MVLMNPNKPLREIQMKTAIIKYANISRNMFSLYVFSIHIPKLFFENIFHFIPLPA